MPKFTETTFVHRGRTDSVRFRPGDDVPDWAAKLVGAHVIDAASAATPAETPDFTAADPVTPEAAAGAGDDGDPAEEAAKASGDAEATGDADPAAETEAAAASAQSAATPAETPDFTATPEKPKRGRPRKAS